MYIVVSKWAFKPQDEQKFRETGLKMRDIMRNTPGVEYVQAFKADEGHSIAIVGYTDEASYKKIMAEGGPFETAAKQQGIEGIGTWEWSERGEAIDREAALA